MVRMGTRRLMVVIAILAAFLSLPIQCQTAQEAFYGKHEPPLRPGGRTTGRRASGAGKGEIEEASNSVPRPKASNSRRGSTAGRRSTPGAAGDEVECGSALPHSTGKDSGGSGPLAAAEGGDGVGRSS